MTKYIFISGGVISGLGKGITAASIACLLKNCGYKVNIIKIDMYLNMDAGTMNPLEHGEVFVTQDGCETDQDLGHYERFLGSDLSCQNYITAGKIFSKILQNERELKYNGACVEAYHEVPKETISFIKKSGKGYDFVIIEFGGTVGEYQNVLFFEAARRLKIEDPKNVFFVHVVYLIIPGNLGEMKTKPAQMSITELNRLGISPDFLICRGSFIPDKKRLDKLSLSSALDPKYIFALPDTFPVYNVPNILENQNFTKYFLKKVGCISKSSNLKEWNKLIDKILIIKKHITVGIAGKYYTSGGFSLEDSYISVVESLKIAGWHNGVSVNVKWIDTEIFDKEQNFNDLNHLDGIIVPGGFGSRGVEGKIKIIEYARKRKIPYLGLCYGMQLAIVEFARNVLGLEGAHTTEVNPKTRYPVIHIMPIQEKNLLNKNYGGSMRLGNWECNLIKGTKAQKLYGCDIIVERHRHRYELNNRFRKSFEDKGLVVSGTTIDNALVEIVEFPEEVHPFFIGTQFHPEFTSKFLSPNPLFNGFVKACVK